MKPVRSRLHPLALAAAALLCSTGALAQTAAPAIADAAPAAEPTPVHSFSFNVALTSDYRYRGISQSRLKPAISAGADYSHVSGFYVGTWLTSIKWIKDAGGDAPMEWDVYGGYKGTAGPLGYDVGLLHYNYPSHKLGVSPNTTELYGALSWNVLTVKYSHSLTNLFGFADSKQSGYLDLTANFDLGNGWSVAPHVGHQWIRHNSPSSYTDYSVTLGKDFGNGLSASLAVVGTDAKKSLYTTPSGRFTGRTGVVAGIKYTF
ncbi:MAG: TorF family putative porin [Ottowia sp.]|nr:TorF family putative porin [Ottowia sp.]